MLSSFYEYHVIEQGFSCRLIFFFVVSSNDRFLLNFLTKILPWAKGLTSYQNGRSFLEFDLWSLSSSSDSMEV